MCNMNKQRTQEIGSEWKRLNEEYDNLILELIDSPDPTPLPQEKLEGLKKMQEVLFNVEVELFKVLKGE